jgi:cob(I)alamin adenosyltransferase
MSAGPWRGVPSARWSRSAATDAVRTEARQYLNRLSDLLFVLARVLNRANLDGLGGDDVYWQSERLARDA